MSEDDIQWEDDDIQWDDDDSTASDPNAPTIKEEGDLAKPSTTPEALAQQRLDESRIAARKRYFFYKRIDQLEQYSLDLMKTKHGIQKAFVASMTGKFHVDSPVDLEALVAASPNAELDRTVRASAHINLRHPSCSVQINPGGHVSILGVTSASDMYLAARRIARLIQISGACPVARFTGFEINNVVLSITFPFTFRLAAVQSALVKRGIDASFAEDIFPCIKIDGLYPQKNTVQIFHSGSFTVMGLRSLSASIVAVDYYYRLLKEINLELQDQTQIAPTFGRYQARIVTQPSTGDVSTAMEKKFDIDGTPLNEEDDFTLEHDNN